MIVGEAVSRKVDPEKTQLKFKVPETEDPAAEAMRSLIDVDDQPSSIKGLHSGIVETEDIIPPSESVTVTAMDDFLVDDHEDWDKDLRKYPIPDSDAEDSDDDPMLINREKTPNPLYTPSNTDTNNRYIRDLMKYLQADNYDKVHVGLKTAPTLIRQKATFGTEVSDQAYDLARIILAMQDTYEMEEFQEMRQATLIGLVASAPEIVVGYLINVFFTGDISIQQKCILLSAIGIGARELAGLEKIVPPPSPKPQLSVIFAVTEI
jgi:telomere length regulation protein